MLTHVCRGWRELFISRSSLWTRLDCMLVDKTELYIERSKSSPLEICVGTDNAPNWEEAFILTVPHFGRLRTLSISGNPAQVLPVLSEHFSRPAPLFHNLRISLVRGQAPVLPDNLFNGDLSSLRELSLTGVITPLPWRGLSNLTTFNLCHVPENEILLTQLLDFFESSPHLHHILLHDSIPNSSDAPTGRVVSLPHLKELSVIAQPPHSILLNHLSIPAGASLRLEFDFSGAESPVPSYLPKSPRNLHNLSHITAINFHLELGKRFARLSGPNGELRILGNWAHGDHEADIGVSQFWRSLLDQFDISKNQRLAISFSYFKPPSSAPIETWSIYQSLRSMVNLRTLVLARCINLPFFHILNPNENSSKTVLCPQLEELVLFIKVLQQFRISELLGMAEERASRGAKLSIISIVTLGNAYVPTKEVFQLRKYVSHVEYKFDDALPEWDA